MTVSTIDVANAVFSVLSTQADDSTYPTIAGASVFMPRDWPVQQINVPILKIASPSETKESLGKAGIQFTTTSTIEVIGEVSAKATEGDATAGKVLAALALFAREVEIAVIGAPVLFGGKVAGLIQQLQSVQTKFATNVDGTLYRGAFSMTFDFNFYQGTEDFQLPVIAPIDRFHIYQDLINVADLAGDYANPPLGEEVTPAPRPSGPDGRVEGEFEVIPES